MKTALIYLFGIIGIIIVIKLYPLTSLKADKLSINKERYKIDILKQSLDNKDALSSVNLNTVMPNNIENDDIEINIIESIDDIETAAGIEEDNETKVVNQNELNYDGFARNYYEQAPDLTLGESIAYSIDYLKSTINIFDGDSGFYGSIGFIYIYDIYNDGRSERKQNNFKQEYNLGYRGDIYSPKLLKYSLSTTIRYENIEDSVNGITNKNKIESYDYEAKLNFLSRTRIPFSLYAIKVQRPNTIFYENTKGESVYDNLSLGLSGQINLKMFKINYSASESKGTYEDIFSKDDRENRVYKTTFTKETDNHSIRLTYDSTDQIIDRKSISYSSKSNIKNENVGLIYRAKISDFTRLNAQAYYRTNRYADNLWTENETQSILSNLNLSWNPKGKHTASISVSADSIKDENIKLNTENSIENIQVSQSYGYRMSKNLNISQSSNYGIVFSDFYTMENINLSTGVNYTTKINANTTINMSANGGFNSNSNDSDSNTSIADITSYTYRANAGVNQILPSIYSRVSIGFGYTGSINTLDETKKSYNIDFSMDTILYSIMKNQLSINYINDNMKSISNTVDTLISRTSSRITITDEIDYTTRIGIRGALKSKVSIQYLLAQTTDRGDIDKLMPRVDLLFKYRLGQKIRHTSKFNIYKELFYDTTSYNFGADLRFTSGKLSASIEYIYNKTTIGGDIDILDRDMHRINMKFKRKF